MSSSPAPKRRLVLLHGFSGSGESWRPVVERLPANWQVLSVDLLGHGAARSVEVDSFDSEVDRVAATIGATAPNGWLLAGYSMGARIGLGLLCRHSRLFRAGFLIGVNRAPPSAVECEDRCRQDERWARLLEEKGVEEFVAQWSRVPLFASQGTASAAALDHQDRVRSSQDPRALARAMRVLSLGRMPDYRARWSQLEVPVRLIAGALDEKFCRVAGELASSMPLATSQVVPGVGHNVVLEAPDTVARLLTEDRLA